MSISSNPTNLQVNVNSLIGRLSLNRTEAALSKTIRNLSTGVRIHSGRDDPAGFISSSMMRTDIASMSQAVANCQRANSVISTVDSTLSEMSTLMVDLRGLVTQAASTGGESPATLKSLQLQADAILNTMDYLANSTSYKDLNLIDGSLGFTTYGVDSSQISNLVINQANFLGKTEKDISVQVLETPKQAELFYPYGALKSDISIAVGGTGGIQNYSFSKDASVADIADAVNRFSDATGVGAKVYSKATAGSLGLTSYGKDNDIVLMASETGQEASNFVVRYTAPESGNETLSLNITEGNGNDPTIIEVMLKTQTWEKAEYHYNGQQDGISNNEFTILSKYAGSEFNDIDFVFNNVYGTDQETGVDLDLTGKPKTFTINLSYNEADPTDPNNSTVNDLAQWIGENPLANSYFELQNTVPSNGSGPLIPTTSFEQNKQGVDGGAVLSTAADVATLINTADGLKDAKGNGRVSALLPTGSTGAGIVTPFTESAFYGDPSESNLLQFLGPANSPDIKFVSTPGTPLSIDDTTYPPVYGKASAMVQGLEAGTSFILRARDSGPEGDNVGVIMRDSTDEGVVFDAERNAVVVSVDFAGRAEDPDRAAFTMNDLKQWVADDPFVSSKFSVEPTSTYDPANPPAFSNPGYIGMDTQVGETGGGVVSPGTVLIHLETDKNGIVKTTANDLVKFFNDPSTEQDREILQRLGISVSNVDPTNANVAVCTTGLSANGTGLLKPTYNPNDINCEDTTGLYPDIVFGSYGSDIETDHPTGTTQAQNGVDAGFTITAKKAGATYNNTTVRVLNDSEGPSVKYNPLTQELVVGSPPLSPLTADEVIDLINSDPSVSSLFVASRAPHSTGEGLVSSGDRATLTGGIKAYDSRATGEVVSSNGVNAMFEVSAKKSDEKYDNTQVLIVSDIDGPKVSYDQQSKQLTIGIDPSNPPTALQIVDLINSTPDIMNLFEASIPPFAPGTEVVPTGNDPVRVGDSGTLTAPLIDTAFGALMFAGNNEENLGITFYSIEYGSNEFVSVVGTPGTDFPLSDRYGNIMEKTYGTNIVAKIDGQSAIGNGRIASMATSDLDMSIWIDPSVEKGDVFGFRIDGGGALIQLGPDPISSHQARLGIQSMNTSDLGGVTGKLSLLRDGNEASLLNDTSRAFKIIEEVTTEIASLRSRLGAFQKYQLGANMENMLDAIEIETGAMSEIKDTDFAAASSALAREQLLMQANIAALQQSSQSTQMLLGLLQ